METADMQEQIGKVDDNAQVKITQSAYGFMDIPKTCILEFQLYCNHPPVEIENVFRGQPMGSKMHKEAGSAVFSISIDGSDDSILRFVEYIKSHLGDTVKWGDLWSHYKGCWNRIRTFNVELFYLEPAQYPYETLGLF